MMYYVLNMPLQLVVGTSSATIIITAFSSVAGYAMNGIGRAHLPPWSFGFIDLQRGIALAIGSILLARVGAYVSFHIHPYRLRKLFMPFLLSSSQALYAKSSVLIVSEAFVILCLCDTW
jgi:uncharacterized membrane protein YfcA